MAADFILGSGSPRRHQMLSEAGFLFEVDIPADDEDLAANSHLDPADLVILFARNKAKALGKAHPGRIILTADTIVVIDRRVLGKPADQAKAAAMLESLSGKTHSVLTGFGLFRNDSEIITRAVTTQVTFRALSGNDIRRYTVTGLPLDKAGAYGIQDMGGSLVERINGSYTNVVGLPMAEVVKALGRAGIEPRGE